MTTNADLLRASGEDPEWINSWIGDPTANDTSWSQFKNADEAIASLSRDPQKLAPSNYTKISNLYRKIYPSQGGESGGTWADLGRSLTA